jgi:hypothetical protein
MENCILENAPLHARRTTFQVKDIQLYKANSHCGNGALSAGLIMIFFITYSTIYYPEFKLNKIMKSQINQF